MWLRLWLFFYITFQNNYHVHGHCIDIHSHIISQGVHYEPTSHPCSLCICDKGNPISCKPVVCAPPQNCKSFELGSSCVDNILTAHDGYKDTYDVALRFIASTVTAVLSLSLLFFLFHRLKRRKVLVHQNQQLNEDQRSLNSIGYITGSLSYLPDNMGYLSSGNNELEFRYDESSAHYSLWKPHGNYFPQGEAPPPYEEAIRGSQMESDIINSQIRNSNTAFIPQNIQRQTQVVESMQSYIPVSNQSTGNGNSANSPHYVNISVQNSATHNRENSKSDNQNVVVHHPGKVKNTTVYEKSQRQYIEKPEKAEKPYENIAICSSGGSSSNKHISNKKRTTSGYNKIQKAENAYENFIIDRSNVIFNKPEMYNATDEGYKLRKPERNKDDENPTELYEEISAYDNRHRTIINLSEYQSHNSSKTQKDNRISMHSTRDRKLRVGERSESNLRSLLKLSEIRELPIHRTLPKNLHELIVREIPNNKKDSDIPHRSQQSSYETATTLNPSKSHGSLIDYVKSDKRNDTITIQGVPLNFLTSKEPKSRSSNEDELRFVSYQCLSSSQDDDDYRSECENCKSSGFTISQDEEADVLNETMTLQRRPLEIAEEASYYRTSLTLPTQTRKPRAVPNSNRENWFTSMQETSSSEESD